MQVSLSILYATLYAALSLSAPYSYFLLLVSHSRFSMFSLSPSPIPVPAPSDSPSQFQSQPLTLNPNTHRLSISLYLLSPSPVCSYRIPQIERNPYFVDGGGTLTVSLAHSKTTGSVPSAQVINLFIYFLITFCANRGKRKISIVRKRASPGKPLALALCLWPQLAPTYRMFSMTLF